MDQSIMEEMHKRIFDAEGNHQIDLKKERDEVTPLQQQIDKMEKKHKAEVDGIRQDFVEERDQLSGKVDKTEGLLKDAELLVISAQQDIDALQTKSKTWQSELDRVNSFIFKNFPEANMFSLRAINKVRSESSEPTDPSGEVTIDEHLAALSERVKTLKSCGVNSLKAAIHVLMTLWPK